MKRFLRLLRFLAPLYPLILFTTFVMVVFHDKSHAGQIRSLVLKPNLPGKIYLAVGESTAISFPSKPEKLSPGSPSKVHIEFVTNTDITVTPLSSSRVLGNLIVYTRSGRYVVLFEPGSPATYDDAVNINFGLVAQPLHLQEDSYFAELVTVALKPRAHREKETTQQVTILLTTGENKMFGEDFFALIKDRQSLRCPGCAIYKKQDGPQIICQKQIKVLSCENSQFSKINLMRRNP